MKGERKMKCPQCGHENGKNAQICAQCGSTLPAPHASPASPRSLHEIAGSPWLLAAAASASVALLLFLLQALLFPALQEGFNAFLAACGVISPWDGTIVGAASIFFFLPAVALCAGLWIAYGSARRTGKVSPAAYKALRTALHASFLLFTAVAVALLVCLFPLHLPEFAKKKVITGFSVAVFLWLLSAVYYGMGRMTLKAAPYRGLRQKQGTVPCTILLSCNGLFTVALFLGLISACFPRTLFSSPVTFLPAFLDGFCRGGSRILGIFCLLAWMAERALLTMLLLRCRRLFSPKAR